MSPSIPAPTSSVTALSAITSTDDFTVDWSGTDDAGGSGISSFTIYVSDDSGSFTPWLADTTLTSATYTGLTSHTYSFYSVATDNVGNIELTPAAAQSSTLVQLVPNIVVTDAGGTYDGAAFAATATVTDYQNTDVSGQGIITFTYYVGLDTNVESLGDVAPSDAGTYTVIAHFQSNAVGYSDASSLPISFMISPADLVVMANNQSRLYGSANPELTGNLSGVVSGDNITASYSTSSNI